MRLTSTPTLVAAAIVLCMAGCGRNDTADRQPEPSRIVTDTKAEETPVQAPPIAEAATPVADRDAATGPARIDDGAGKEILKLELPQAFFIGTPEQIRSKDLDPARGKEWKRGDFLVPKGTRLLSHGSPVTSSDSMPIIGELELVTDGEKAADEGCYVELGPSKQWVQIDLGASHELAAIIVWHYHSMARIYKDVVVQVADDPAFASGVRTIFNNDRDNSSGFGVGTNCEYVESNQGELMDAQGVRGRYVRLYSNGSTANSMNHYTEVAVFGR